MKVLQITPVAPPQHSGMANAAGEIFKATKAAGAEADLVAPFGGSTIAHLHHLRLPGTGFLSFTPRIISLYKEYDIIHLHYPCYGNAMMLAVARRLNSAACGRKPLVVSYHMDTVGRWLRKPVFAFHARFFAPRFLRQADKIVVASRDYAEHSLLAKYPELMEKLVEIPFGIDMTRFVPALKEPIYLAGEKDAKQKNILFVGALDEQHYFKGVNILLKAVARLPGIDLTVIGEGNLKESYIRRAKEMGIGERVKFIGRVPDPDLSNYYRLADVFCLPSLDRSEAYSIALLEAAASGLPAVTSDLPGVRSVVHNGETGLLVKPGDPVVLAEALNMILSDPQLACRMGAAARAFALKRTWKSAGEKYLEVYKKLL